MTTIKTINLEPEKNPRLANLCGQLNENIHYISEQLDVDIQNRAFQFTIKGKKEAVRFAEKLLHKLYAQTILPNGMTEAQIQLCMQDTRMLQDNPLMEKKLIQTKLKVIRPRNTNQTLYVDNIEKNDINFGIGPAGTGKTYLAVACAVEALEQKKVERIILVRPAVEAGEHLGFLPGDLSQKVDPYLRPLYDALYDTLGQEIVEKYIERGIIEIAPLAFMRGRTLNEAFIILDESQNTTVEQMKMFLTRIGFGSTAVICGDITQTDLAKHITSGLGHSTKILQEVQGIAFTYFTADDVVRHPLVQRIVAAYEKYEKQN